MPGKAANRRYAATGEKDIWHRVDLQDLRDDRFVYVANQILRGRYTLLELKTMPLMKNFEMEIAN
jgi:hypothetical protein